MCSVMSYMLKPQTRVKSVVGKERGEGGCLQDGIIASKLGKWQPVCPIILQGGKRLTGLQRCSGGGLSIS
ncbi:hypothetical protein FJTKL_00930, partial [Diaporthe vaccinii]